MKPKLKTILLTGGAVLLAAGNVWAAASGVAAIDTPITVGTNIIQNGAASLFAVAGVAYGGYEIAFNRHVATGLGAAGAGLAGGAMTHNGSTVSGLTGGATAALIHIPHIIHHVARLLT